MYPQSVILVVLALGLTECLGLNRVTLVYSNCRVGHVEFSQKTTVAQFKEQIAKTVNISTSDQAILDFYATYPNLKDGLGEFKDTRTLEEYGITDAAQGNVLTIAKRVGQSASDGELAVLYADNLLMKTKFQEKDTVQHLKDDLKEKTGIDTKKQRIIDWYPNPAQDKDGGELKDAEPLSKYGFMNGDKGRTVIVLQEISAELRAPKKGELTVIFGKNEIAIIPFTASTKVIDFKKTIEKTVKIPAASIEIIDLQPNPVQTHDSKWMDEKTLAEYNLTDETMEKYLFIGQSS